MIPEQDKGSGLARNHSGECQILTGTEGVGRKADSFPGRDEGEQQVDRDFWKSVGFLCNLPATHQN